MAQGQEVETAGQVLPCCAGRFIRAVCSRSVYSHTSLHHRRVADINRRGETRTLRPKDAHVRSVSFCLREKAIVYAGIDGQWNRCFGGENRSYMQIDTAAIAGSHKIPLGMIFVPYFALGVFSLMAMEPILLQYAPQRWSISRSNGGPAPASIEYIPTT